MDIHESVIIVVVVALEFSVTSTVIAKVHFTISSIVQILEKISTKTIYQ